MSLDNISTRQKGILVGKRIKPQFPESAEGLLMFAIVDQAISDLFAAEVEVPDIIGDETEKRLKEIKSLTTQSNNRERERSLAANFLRGDIYPAVLCGVEADWIRSSIKKVGCDLV